MDIELVKKEGPDGLLVPTAEGYEALERAVTNSRGQVYFFQNVSPVLVAGVMARVSRSADDVRSVYLNEFAQGGNDRLEDLMSRVLGAYGDDSVQQLAPVQFVIERTSNLMTKLIEWSRLMAYLEQSTRYINFSTKVNGDWRYYTPPNLSPATRAQYAQALDQIFACYSDMVERMIVHVRAKYPRPDKQSDPNGYAAWPASTKAQALDALRPVLPVATQSTVCVVGNAQTLERFYIFLRSQPLAEAHDVAEQLLAEARKVPGLKSFLDRADRPDRGGAMTDYLAGTRDDMTELADTWALMGGDQGMVGQDDGQHAVSLTDFWPKTERELVHRLFFGVPGVNLSLRTLERRVSTLTQQEIATAIQTHFGTRGDRRHRPGRALEKAFTEWEIVDEYATFRDLQRHRMLCGFEWQQLTPYLGYSVPELVTEAGLEEPFRNCFAISFDLYQMLAQERLLEVSQYATLLGHRMRYSFTASLRELVHMLELRTQPAGHPGYRRICQQMHNRLAEVYPTLAACMNFVDHSGDAELARQAQESAIEARKSRM